MAFESSCDEYRSVSVALCTYNGAQYLEEQLESIARQTLRPQEIVVCDDASTDETASVVEKFAIHAPFDVRWARNEVNLGSSRNFFNAISLCQGELIALCDQDDRWHPHKLERQCKVMEDSSVGGVFSNARLMNSQGECSAKRLWMQVGYSTRDRQEDLKASTLFRRNVVTGATMLVRARLRPLFVPVGSSWVHDAWMSWVLVINSRLVALDDLLIDYRIHPKQQIGAQQAFTWRKRLAVARAEGDQHYMMLLSRFRELQSYVLERKPQAYPEIAEAIRNKIRHLEHRRNLPANRRHRLMAILREWNNYKEFSKGFGAAVKDLLI